MTDVVEFSGYIYTYVEGGGGRSCGGSEVYSWIFQDGLMMMRKRNGTGRKESARNGPEVD